MEDSSYTVERTIEDVEFDQTAVDEVRSSVKHNMVDEGHDDLDEAEIESRVRDRLLDIARDRTMYEQGDNRLHNDIDHDLTVKD